MVLEFLNVARQGNVGNSYLDTGWYVLLSCLIVEGYQIGKYP